MTLKIKPRRLLIAGAGDLGLRVAALAQAAAVDSVLVRRTARTQPGLTSISADLLDAHRWLPELAPCDALLWCATPDQRTPEAYQQIYTQALVSVLDAAAAASWSWSRIVFISSTAVYGQRMDPQTSEPAWQDENSPAVPHEWNGRALVAAEQALQARTPGAVIARLGGIYGPGRDWLLRRVRSGQPCQQHPAKYGNRIQIEDAARAVWWLLRHQDAIAVCNVVDPNCAPEHEVLDWLAAQMGFPALPRIAGEDSGKRIRPAVLIQAGFQWAFPDYRSGYRELLETDRRNHGTAG